MNCTKWTRGGYVEEKGGEHYVSCNEGFNGTREGKPFGLNRPAFLSGSKVISNFASGSVDIRTKRSGSNYDLRRPAFIKPPIAGRTAVDFDRLQALTIEQEGATVRLGDSTLKALFDVAIPDERDVKWLAEKQRRTNILQQEGLTPAQIAREFEVNKPLGRPQRTNTAKRNIGESELSLKNKLKEIKQEIDKGALTRQTQAILLGQMAVALDDVKGIYELTKEELVDIGGSLARLGVRVTREQIGLVPRFVDADYYKDNAGMINLLLYSNAGFSDNPNEHNYERIVLNFSANPDTGLPAVLLRTAIDALVSKVENKRRYFDLARGGVINLGQLRAFAKKFNGFDDPKIFSIKPDNQ
jgi:hypothetical protein